MILLDTNVLLAAHRDDHAFHAVARPWFERTCAGQEQFGVPATVWMSVLRLASSRRIFVIPSGIGDVFAFIRATIGQPNHVAMEPGRRHLDIFDGLCHSANIAGDLVNDAAIAAIAIENGAAVASFDRDFARFPNLRWVNPADQAQ